MSSRPNYKQNLRSKFLSFISLEISYEGLTENPEKKNIEKENTEKKVGKCRKGKYRRGKHRKRKCRKKWYCKTHI
jgi:hypothetical protein